MRNFSFFMMTIFDNTFWWQFSDFWKISWFFEILGRFTLEALITCDTWDTDYIDFLKSCDTWDTAYMWHLRHWLHCWQLSTTLLRITLWSWIALRQGQHSQFLRCFETEISVLETFPRGKWLFRGWIRQRAISKRPTYFSCFNFWRMIIKRQYVWPRISPHYTLLFYGIRTHAPKDWCLKPAP